MIFSSHDALIALGGNQPWQGQGPAQTLRAALAVLAERGADVLAVSRFYQTPCFPAGAGPDYVNAAARIRVAGAPAAMPSAILALLHEVEALFDRQRIQRWGRRTLDLDLLAVGEAVLPDAATHRAWRELPPEDQQTTAPPELVLPHPRLHERAFVLVPLADVAPDWRHPVLGKTVAQMLAEQPAAEVAGVVAIAPPHGDGESACVPDDKGLENGFHSF